jgi:hypothetical protein
MTPATGTRLRNVFRCVTPSSGEARSFLTLRAPNSISACKEGMREGENNRRR